ncbi:sulfatase-like hydrolase/transferase [Bacteroidota bacterium]
MKNILLAFVVGFSVLGCNGSQGDSGKTDDLPNILWLTTEDIGPDIGCYGSNNVTTPVIDELAAKGVLYSNAYASAPVCAPARSSIITGMYSPSIGSHHMRSTGIFPEEFKYFPQYLTEKGYYCTNNSKTDYNLVFDASDIWDESGRDAHWRNKQSADQSFFAVFNYNGTHESRVNGEDAHLRTIEDVPQDLLKNPDEITFPPYFPPTPKVKELWTRYYNNITALDFWIKDLLDQLEEDGLAENTIVFFYGDHGAGVPRHKRWLYDSGLRVPFIVYAPKKYKHLIPVKPGTQTDELISFVDLAPTALNLAGIDIPENMQGRAFLGEKLTPEREYIFAARDRMDERYDMQRAVRDKQYKYIRYYEAAKPFTQYMNTPEKGEIMVAIREAHETGTMPEAGLKLMWPDKPSEELFDVENDPHELNNLVGDADYKDILERMREAHKKWSTYIYDSGLIPETILRRWENTYNLPIYSVLRNENIPMQDIQDLALTSYYKTLAEGLIHENEAVRFWAANGLGNDAGNNAFKSSLPVLAEMLKDPVPVVRMVAARAICKLGDAKMGLPVLTEELKNEDEWVRLYAALVLDEIGETSRPAVDDLQSVMEDQNKYVVRVANHALNHLLGTMNVVR